MLRSQNNNIILNYDGKIDDISVNFTDPTKMGSSEDRNDIFQIPYKRTKWACSLQHGRQATKGRLHGKGWSFWG